MAYKQISNEHRMLFFSPDVIDRMVAERNGYGEDPLDLLQQLEEAECAGELGELDFN